MVDTHIHSKFSADSIADPQYIIQKAIDIGLDVITFTDHYDIDYYKSINMQFDIDEYFKQMSVYREKYHKQIKILLGIEAGIQAHLSEKIKHCLINYPFDYIIGSTHLIHGVDPYYGTLYNDGISKKEAHTDYLNVVYDNIKSYSYFDSMGHIDYLQRYTRFDDNIIYYKENSDIIDLILTHLITEGKAIEINTSVYDRLPFDMTILKRYKEIGGKLITIGSDAHKPEDLARHFKPCIDLIKSFGFDYVTYYENRIPKYLKL